MGSFNTVLGSPLLIPGGPIIFGSAEVILNLYTLTSNATGAGSLTLPDSATRFNAFTFGGAGNGGNTQSGFITFFGRGGGGGGRADLSYTRDASTSTLALISQVGTAVASESDVGAGFSQVLFGSTDLLSATGGQRGADGGFTGGGGGTGSTASGAITGWSVVGGSSSTFTGATGQPLSGSGENNFGGGVGGNSGGDPQRPTALAPLTGSQGRGGNASGSAANRNGQFPGGGGGGSGISGGFVGPGSGATGAVIIEVTAEEGLVASDFSLTNFGFVDNGPITP